MSSKQDYAIFGKFGFERKPVGVKFLTARPEGLRRLDKVLDFCEMLVEAQEGKAFYATKEEFTCIGPLLLGMVADDPIFEAGRVGPKLGAYKEVRANRRIYQYLPRLKPGVINYVVFAPLDEMAFDPDVFVITASVTQAEILLRAGSYTSGEAWSAWGTTVAGCAWLYLHPYLTGEMNLTVTGLGFGMRARRLFPEGLVMLSVPWDRLPGLIDNLRDMEWVPPAFTLGREGHKKNVKRILEELQRENPTDAGCSPSV